MYDQLPDNDNSNYLKGKAYVKLGKLIDPMTNYNLAIESFSKAILLSNVGNPSYYYERGNTYKLLNNMDKASEDINMSKSLLSNATGLHHVDISNKLGNIGEYPNKLAEIEKYNKILEKNPSKHQAHNLKGLALKDSGMYNEALESLCKAIELLHNNANYYIHRGEVLYLLDNKEAAAEDFTMAEKLLEENKSNYDEFSIMRIKDKISDHKHNYQQDQINVHDLLQKSINEQQNIQNNIMDILNTVNMRINERTELYSWALQSHGNEDIIQGIVGNNSNQEDHNDHSDL